MDITRTAIEKSRVTIVSLLVIFVAGMSVYEEMPRNEDPGFIIRAAQVLTFFPGASPERVELLVTDKLEKAIEEIPELDFVNSTSRTGLSVVIVNILESERDMRPIWDDVRRKVERASRELPKGVIGPIVNDEFGDVFGTVVTLTGEGYSYAELKEVADQVRNELLKIDNTAKVEIHGAQQERIFVEYHNARLAELGISAFYLKNILDSRNILLPGGDINTGYERIVLEPSGNFESVEELSRTIINVPGSGDLVYLGDIARVYRGYVDPSTQLVRSSGIPALALGVSLKEGGNLIELGRGVKETLRRLEERYPIGLEFDLISFQPDIVEKKVDDFVVNLLQAVAIVIVVMLISLGFRTGMVVSTLIPMTVITSLLVMDYLSIGLDQMSLSALIIALGLLVDNAIVMSESVLVRLERGMDAVEAAVDSARELRVPLLVSSLTTSAAFLPIYLAESTVGEYTAPLFEVVSIALLCSWLLSLTMVPLFCVKFMRAKPKSANEVAQSNFYLRYRSILLLCLRNRWTSVAVTIVVFFVAMQGFGLIPNIFFPAKDQATFTAEFELPIGVPIERTQEVVEGLEAFMANELLVGEVRSEGIVNWASFIGQGPPKFSLAFGSKPASPEYAMMLVNTTSYAILHDMVARMEAFCLENYPDVKPDIRSMSNGPPVANPIAVRISGEGQDQVFAIVDRVKEQLKSLPGSKNIADDWGPRTKKLEVRIDQARARRAGLTSQDVAVSLQTVLSGFEATQYREADEVIPVSLRSVEADRQDVGKLESLNIFSQASGRSVPLKQVADIEVVWQPSKILRRDRLKTVTVSAGIGEGVTAIALFEQLRRWFDTETQSWPVGYSYEFGGEWEASVEGNESIGVKVPIALLIIVLLLVGQFNSLRRPVIILLTIPLGLVGVVFGLLIANSYFGFITFLGVIALSGIIINNAIVLIDRIKIEIEENGLEPPRAVIEAAQGRLRPILLTTCTTVGGMVPLWYGGGPMFEPMAITIIFGLLFATLLTLGVVPVLYSLFFKVQYKEFNY